jgi:imidazolonepropionase
MHAEQLGRNGGALLAADRGCASADHLEHVIREDAEALAAGGTVAVLLPTASLTTRQPWAPVATLREAGVTLALGTDCNPGTSWCESMPYVLHLACFAMGMSVDEAWRAATVGAAASLRRTDIGSLTPGSWADVVMFDAEHEADVIAHLGGSHVASTYVAGTRV